MKQTKSYEGAMRCFDLTAFSLALLGAIWLGPGTAQEIRSACTVDAPSPGIIFNGRHYFLSREVFAADENADSAIKAKYGPAARLADWNDIAILSMSQDIKQFADQLGLPHQSNRHDCGNVYVTVNGEAGPDGRNRYFIARHDGVVPDQWFGLSALGDHYIDLGRWTYSAQALISEPAENRAVNDGHLPSLQVASVSQDQTDIVAQVLNYSRFGMDQGRAGSFYARVNKCSYKLVESPNRFVGNNSEDLISAFPLPGQHQINLDEIDPRNLTFEIGPAREIVGGMFTGDGSVSAVKSDNQVITAIQSRLNLDRLQRGWRLIYEKYCAGKSKPF
jgi:hypothetical protein